MSQPPHVILLMGDEQPVFYAGCYGKKNVRTIVRGPWKLTNCCEAQPELFNLETDPGEWHNLANAPECRAIRTELETGRRSTSGGIKARNGGWPFWRVTGNGMNRCRRGNSGGRN